MRYRPLTQAAYLLVSFLCSAAIANDITMDEIEILDDRFELLRIIDDPTELAKAQELWSTLIPIESLPNTNWTHKLDIQSDTVGGRWLYNAEGYVAKLNKQLKPMYKVSNVTLFNEIYLDL